MINYANERNKYRPTVIKILLIGEAPPPNGKNYFYVPRQLSLNKSIELDTSLPATIFQHYFKKRPKDIAEYHGMLLQLQTLGVYLIDIIDEPLKIRMNKENENYLISKLPLLGEKVITSQINLDESDWIFLLARTSYTGHIKRNYPKSEQIRWKDFRLS